MKKYKKILGAALAISMMLSSISYAEVVVSPVGPGDTIEETTAASPETGLTQTTSASQTSGTSQTTSTSQAVTAGEEKPVILSEGAVLLDGASGKVLFGKNENKQFYPASITKIMTGLLTAERCNLTDTVTFSESATTNLESGAVSLAITAGDKLTVEQCLYGLLLKSANEIGNGLAEYMAGSVSGFADMMNAKAKELGCQNTHFSNPHGLNDTTHLTTPYDMALIARAAFANPVFRKVDTTLTYDFPAVSQATAKTITMGHKMMYPSDSRYYAGIVGGKTGYTSKAGNTLVTGVERDGVTLIAVVMKSSSTHYADTKKLLDYGFANYSKLTGGQPAQTSSTQVQAAQTSSTPTQTTQAQTEATQSGVTNENGPTVNNSVTSPAPNNQTGTWSQDSQGWKYTKADGNLAKDEWITEDGTDYWIDSDSYMAHGWRQYSNGAWYYFRSSGAMAKNYWAKSEDDWYYLGEDGVMMKNTTTPDGYKLDETGRWVK